MTTVKKRRYALLAGLAGAFVLFLVLRGRGGTPADELLAAPGPALGQTLDPGGGGSTGGTGGALGSEFTDFVQMTEDRLAAQDARLAESFADLQDVLESMSTATAVGPWMATIDPDWEPPTEIPDTTTQGPAGQVPKDSPGNAKALPGFWWNVGGKRTWVTLSNRDRFLALFPDSDALDRWIRKHPKAAQKIRIKPGSPPPKSKPPKGKGGLSLGRVGVGAGVSAGRAPARSLMSSGSSRGSTVSRILAIARPTAPTIVRSYGSFARGGSANPAPAPVYVPPSVVYRQSGRARVE